MTLLEQVLPTLGAAALTGAITYLGTRKVEREKSRQRILEMRNEVQFRALHEKRGKIVEETHTKLVAIEQALRVLASAHRYATPNASEEIFQRELERQNKAEEEFFTASGDFWSFYQVNRIFLEAGTCKLIDNFVERAEITSTDVSIQAFSGLADLNPDELEPEERTIAEEARREQERVWKAAFEEIPQVLESIRAEFRVLIGVSERTSA